MDILNVGRYRLLSHLSGGASSDVYVAEDTLSRRKVALKLLRKETADERQLRHFEREARCASMLNHPNILTIFDVGRSEDLCYLASEYADGETLRKRLQRGPMTAAEVLDVATAVSGALAAAHEAWIVHRDIKPEHVVLQRDGAIKVIDFGAAALDGDGDSTDPLSRPGVVVGTLRYLSPEQVRGEAIIDSRSDIYSLGVVVYEMLAGRPPFEGHSALEVLAAIVEREPPPLPAILPAGVRDLVTRMLRKSIYERPQTAAEVAAAFGEMRLELTLRLRARRDAG